MPRKKNVTVEQIKSLFTFENNKYVIKEDETYVEAFSSIVGGVNRNDVPFTKNEIRLQPTIKEFSFNGKDDFVFICNLKATPISNITSSNWDNEKIYPYNFKNQEVKKIFSKAAGVAYILTCNLDGNEYIVKFGQTRTPFSKRLGSYNCGVINNLRTASTTNIKILQSFVACNTFFNLYIFDCGDPQPIVWRGETSIPMASSMPIAVEDIMVKKFIEQFRTKPLANVQTNATETV